jgi:hypothetical protein
MDDIMQALERIKILECSTGELEKRVEDILENYNVATRDRISVARAEERDRDGLQAYSALVAGDKERDITVLAQAGLDDYVAMVVDAYISD